jgi:acetamidase/formamidase
MPNTLLKLAAAALLVLSGAACDAETQRVDPQIYYHTFSHSHPPAARIRAGDVVITRTLDSGGQDEKSVKRAESVNPLTGPFSVEGAEPGDALVVHFRRVRLNRDWGWSAWRLGLFSLMPEYVERVYSNDYKADLVRKGSSTLVPWDIDLARGTTKLREPVSSRIALEFPVRPMLGCVGVAPAGDFAPTSVPSGPYGGNLDYNQIGEGATVILPVYHPGALLFIGDGHALMADGEPTSTGVETSMDVEFSVEVRKGARVTGPRVETSDELISLGSQPEFASSLDRGLQLATTDMVRWLVNDYGLEPWAAHVLIGAVGRYEVVTVQGTMALRIAKRHLAAR